MSQKHRVVVLGGGFAGLNVVRGLRARDDFDITLIDRRNFHVFQPLLYQVATGGLSPAEIAYPLRAIFRGQSNVRVLLAEARDLNPTARCVVLDDGSEVRFDTLVVATGARTFYFGNDRWEEIAPGLKTIEDATRIRHRILYAFEAAERETDAVKRRAWMTVVVVGGGPTGVELAGAIGEIANDTMRGDFRSIHPEETRILLLEGGPRLLSAFEPKLSDAAERSLMRLGVRSRTGVRVTQVDDTGVTLTSEKGEERIDTRTVVWAAGVRGSVFGAKLSERLGVELDRAGRVPVQADLTVPGHPNVLVLGDLAQCAGPDGKALPGVAPVAMQQGTYAARLLRDRLDGGSTGPFQYVDKGNMAVIGRAAAIAEIWRFRFSGLVAWLIWLFLHLMYLVGFQNRLLVFIRWGLQYITFARGARLITGAAEPNPEQRKLERLLAASKKDAAV